MEVILTQKVEGLGDRGQVVRVKDGYARNYLFPKRLAVPASEKERRILEEENKRHASRDARLKSSAMDLAEKMRGVSCTLVVQAAEEDKLYGSVTAHDIARAVSEQGYEVDHKMVVLEEPIKKLGVYTVPIRLHREVEVPIKVWVVKE